MPYNAQLSGVCPQLVNSTKVVKSTEAHNGSKWHCVPQVKNSFAQRIVESTALSQRQISRSSCTETSQKALRHMPDQRLLASESFSLFFAEYDRESPTFTNRLAASIEFLEFGKFTYYSIQFLFIKLRSLAFDYA